jgi:protein-tyrosine-phosphatase
MNVLFVCTGNTCRSPLAEAIARRVARERGLEGYTFSSAGTDAVEGAATEDTIAVARERGLDLTAFRSRRLTRDLAGEADVVVVMAEHHLADPALADLPQAALFAGGPVRDPYGLGPGAYRQTYEQLERAVGDLLDELEAKRVTN